MKNKIITTLVANLVMLGSMQLNAQVKYKTVEQKISAVENNLVSWVKLDSSCNWNIYDRMRDGHVPGLVIAVIHDYKTEWIKAYGYADTNTRQPVTVNTLFQLASVGKTINAIAQLSLVQQGKLDLSADINHYLKRWKFPYDSVSQGRKITCRQLLNHSAGLSVHGFEGYGWEGPLPSIVQTLDGVSPANNPPVRSISVPGTRFEYSGGGITITEMMLEDITGVDYSEYLFDHVFKPLQVFHSFFSTYPPYKDFALGYRYDRLPMKNGYMRFTERACGGALWSTAGDLAKLVIELQLSLKGRSNKVLSPAMAQLMLRPSAKGNNSGLGCFIDDKAGELYFQHSGLNPGYCSQYYGSLKNGNGVVVLCNADNTAFRDEVVNAVATVYGWKSFYNHTVKKILQPAAGSQAKFTGKYRFENSDKGPEIFLDKGQLFLKDPDDQSAWRIYFTSATNFFMLEAKWADQEFFFNADGSVGGFNITTGTYHSKVLKME